MLSRSQRARNAVSVRSTERYPLPLWHQRWYRPQSMDGYLVALAVATCAISPAEWTRQYERLGLSS